MARWLAVLSIFVGGGASLLMLVLLLAGSPNSKPEQLAEIKRFMFAVALVAMLGLTGGGWALYAGRPALAAALGIAPLVFVIVLFVVLLLRG